jgi:hypothetical protein
MKCGMTMNHTFTMITVDPPGLKIIKSESLYQCPVCKHVVNVVDNTERDNTERDNNEKDIIDQSII